MKKAHAVLIGVGCFAAAAIPIAWSVHSVQKMQNEVAIVHAAAEKEAEERIAQAELRVEEAEAAREKAEAENLERQRQIAKEIAEEQARKSLEENTALAWNQFLDAMLLLEEPSAEGASPEEELSKIIDALAAVPRTNVDAKVVSMTNAVQTIFEDLSQHLLAYDADLKALDARTVGTNFSAGIDGCSLVTTTMNTESSFWNVMGCAAGMAAGAGLSNENLKMSVAQLDKEFEQDFNLILDRLLVLEDEMEATVEHLSTEYAIETPEEFL